MLTVRIQSEARKVGTQSQRAADDMDGQSSPTACCQRCSR